MSMEDLLNEQDRQSTYNVILGRVRKTNVAV
jgi:type IV secretory pathway ATPase VirB11/archaellum biosynthesis ATPase